MKLKVLVVAFALSALGCKSIPFVTKEGAGAIAPTSGKATLVLAQSFTYPQVNFVDDKGKVVAQIGARQFTVVQVDPGPIHLAAFPGKDADRGDRVEGTVEAGKVYYLVAGFRFRGISFQVVSPRNDQKEWNERKTYTTDLTGVTMDPARAGEVETALGEDRTKIYANIDDDVKGWSPDEKKVRNIQPGDGDAP